MKPKEIKRFVLRNLKESEHLEMKATQDAGRQGPAGH